MHYRPFLAFVMVLGACGEVGAAALPAGAAILPASEATELLRQCSRSAPEAGESGWSPAADDVAALEAALPEALAAQRPSEGGDWSRAPQGWHRQYVGIVRGGRRYIYGNFFPEPGLYDSDPDGWRREPVMVCDGGPAFFGVEYDVETGRFTHFGFNGSA